MPKLYHISADDFPRYPQPVRAKVEQLVAELRGYGADGCYILEMALQALCDCRGVVCIGATPVAETAGYLDLADFDADRVCNERLRADIARREAELGRHMLAAD